MAITNPDDKFGDTRSRKDVHESYIENGGSDSINPEQIGNVNTLLDSESKKSGRFNSSHPNSPENLRYGNNVAFLRDYFKDK